MDIFFQIWYKFLFSVVTGLANSDDLILKYASRLAPFHAETETERFNF